MLKESVKKLQADSNIVIRKFEFKDIEEKVRIINDKENNKYLHYDLPLEYEKTIDWFNKNVNNKKRNDFTIEYNNEVAGFIGLLNIDEKNLKAEYYICVDNKFTRKGIAYNSSLLLLKYAFNEKKLNKVYLYTEAENIKAQALFEKLKFRKEGLFKDDLIYNEKKIYRYAYGICKDDFYGYDFN